MSGKKLVMAIVIATIGFSALIFAVFQLYFWLS